MNFSCKVCCCTGPRMYVEKRPSKKPLNLLNSQNNAKPHVTKAMNAV